MFEFLQDMVSVLQRGVSRQIESGRRWKKSPQAEPERTGRCRPCSDNKAGSRPWQKIVFAHHSSSALAI